MKMMVEIGVLDTAAKKPAKGVGNVDNDYVSQFVQGRVDGPIKVSARA